MLIEATLFIVVMFRIVRPRLRSLVDRRRVAGGLTPNIFAVVLVGILVSAYITNWIGIHAIFGAFVFGAIMPREDAAPLSQEILERLEQVTVLLLLPVFFIATGLNVNIRGLGPRGWLELAAVLVVACVGKFVGAAGAARLSGISARRSSAVGILMNTRGLTELVILNIGFALGILDRQLFTVLVLMAVITTVITDPLLRIVYPERMVARDVAQAERAALGLTAAYRVVAVANGPDSDRRYRSGTSRRRVQQPAADQPVRHPGTRRGGGLRADLRTRGDSQLVRGPAGALRSGDASRCHGGGRFPVL
jgi:NhaP-type Na+/H+ or K+/H+ antiporter